MRLIYRDSFEMMLGSNAQYFDRGCENALGIRGSDQFLGPWPEIPEKTNTTIDLSTKVSHPILH